MPHPKTVFNTGEIAHLWAHQKVAEARNRQGNFYFNGPTIFSYGPHFPIARIVKRKGETAVLFTVRDYSSMTAQHKYDARAACKHMTIFMVPTPGASHKEVISYYKDQCNAALAYVRKATIGWKPSSALNDVETRVKMFNAYAEFFDLSTRMELPEDWKELKAKCKKLSQEQDARQASREEKKRLERERIEALAREEFSKVLEAWENGKFPTYRLPRVTEIYLRLRRAHTKSPLVETSRGAVVSLEFVKVLWGLILHARLHQKAIGEIEMETKLAAITTPERLSYRVDRISDTGDVHAGCHHIMWPQIERFARKLKWLHEQSSQTE